MAQEPRPTPRPDGAPKNDPEPQKPEAAPASPSSLTIPGYVSMGVGLLGVIVGAGFLGVRISRLHDVDELEDECARTGTCGAAEQAEVDDEERKAAAEGIISAISFAVGGAGVVAGTILLVLADDDPPSAAIDIGPVEVRPTITLGGMGVAGRF